MLCSSAAASSSPELLSTDFSVRISAVATEAAVLVLAVGFFVLLLVIKLGSTTCAVTCANFLAVIKLDDEEEEEFGTTG